MYIQCIYIVHSAQFSGRRCSQGRGRVGINSVEAIGRSSIWETTSGAFLLQSASNLRVVLSAVLRGCSTAGGGHGEGARKRVKRNGVHEGPYWGWRGDSLSSWLPACLTHRATTPPPSIIWLRNDPTPPPATNEDCEQACHSREGDREPADEGMCSLWSALPACREESLGTQALL